MTTLVLAGAVASEQGAAAAARTATVVGVLFVLPLALLTVRQVRRGRWSTVDASQPRERPMLFLVGVAGLLALLVYFARTQPGSPLVTGTAGVVVMVGLCAAMTPWVKVSLHTAAAALAATVLLWRGLPLGWLLGAMLPVLAWSRIALGRHRWSEVVVGLVVGAATGTLLASSQPTRPPAAPEPAAWLQPCAHAAEPGRRRASPFVEFPDESCHVRRTMHGRHTAEPAFAPQRRLGAALAKRT